MTSKKLSRQNEQEFTQYVSESVPCIEQFKKYLKKDRYKLDYSLESFKFLDEFIEKLKKEKKIEFGKNRDTFTEDEQWFIVRISYYLGETLIKNFKFKWTLDKTKSSFSFGRAIVAKEGFYLSVEPLNLVMNLWKQGKSIHEWCKQIEKKIEIKVNEKQ